MLTWAVVVVVMDTFVPAPTLTLAELEKLVRDNTPEMRDSVRTVWAVEAQAQAHLLLDNPTLGLSVGTIPLGSRNPPGLDAVSQTMSYGGSLSYRFEVLKRGRRQAQDRAVLFAERARDRRELRLIALDFARVLGSMAVSRMRLGHLSALIADGKARLGETEQRAQSGAMASLDAHRWQVELYRLEAQVQAAEGQASSLAAECARYASRSCTTFAAPDDARAFLDAWLARAVSTTPVAQRSDLRALDALAAGARRAADLARADRVPDITLSVGYLHDRLTIAGHQLNSMNVSASVPLPLFDYGQPAEALATLRAQSFADERLLRARAAEARIDAMTRTLTAQVDRRRELAARMLPRARAVLADVERGYAHKQLGVTEVLLSRLALSELLLAETEAYAEAFAVLVQLLAELPEDV